MPIGGERLVPFFPGIGPIARPTARQGSVTSVRGREVLLCCSLPPEACLARRRPCAGSSACDEGRDNEQALYRGRVGERRCGSARLASIQVAKELALG